MSVEKQLRLERPLSLDSVFLMADVKVRLAPAPENFEMNYFIPTKQKTMYYTADMLPTSYRNSINPQLKN